MDSFNKLSLSRLEIELPFGFGHLYRSDNDGTARKSRVIKAGYIGDEDNVIYPMFFEIIHSNKRNSSLKVHVKQTLPKPDLLLFTPKNSFIYDVHDGEKVTIRKVVANVKKLDKIIDDLIRESNRFYLLYCKPIQ